MNTASKTRHVFILFLADIVWGIAFVAQSKGGDAVGAFSFNGIRFLIGALCLLPVIKILDKKELTVNRPESKKQKKELWIAGSCCGIALFFASNLQQLGISMGAESGKAGFLTATYILMVPILGIFLKRKCGAKIWIGVFISLIGMYFLCMNGTFSLSGSDLRCSDRRQTGCCRRQGPDGNTARTRNDRRQGFDSYAGLYRSAHPRDGRRR